MPYLSCNDSTAFMPVMALSLVGITIYIVQPPMKVQMCLSEEGYLCFLTSLACHSVNVKIFRGLRIIPAIAFQQTKRHFSFDGNF
jgi:hypothetical protein